MNKFADDLKFNLDKFLKEYLGYTYESFTAKITRADVNGCFCQLKFTGKYLNFPNFQESMEKASLCSLKVDVDEDGTHHLRLIILIPWHSLISHDNDPRRLLDVLFQEFEHIISENVAWETHNVLSVFKAAISTANLKFFNEILEEVPK